MFYASSTKKCASNLNCIEYKYKTKRRSTYSLDMHSSRDKFNIFNSMAGIVAGLEDEYTTIDLRNEAIVTGKIESVDGMININMEDVTFYDSRGVKQSFETFYVKARTIRHVHIPKNLTPEELFSRQQRKMSKVIPKEKRTFKQIRAKRNNAETVQEAFKGA